MSFPSEISFIVSPNDKGDNPKRPDYRGEVTIGGVVYELAAWKRVKQGTDRKFVSGLLKIKAPKADPGAYRAPDPAPVAKSEPEPDADVPF